MNIKHYESKTRLHIIWNNIKQKCYNKNNDQFYLCGDKGIIVYNEWEDFIPFRKWALKNGYKDNLILHRKNSSKNYDPDNCIWITDNLHRALRGNIGKVLTVKYNNKEITLSELSKVVGINRETLKSRYLKGCRGQDLIRKPNKGLKVAIA